eukprot:2063811-Alexandrium_andersonii.AAC.1
MCEVRVTITSAEMHRRICRALHYDKRSGLRAGRGRSLATPVPEVGLLAGDRLEVTERLQDVAAFDQMINFPTEVVFWRASRMSLAHHRSNIWDEDIGITPTNTICLDLLRTLYLGPMMSWC